MALSNVIILIGIVVIIYLFITSKQKSNENFYVDTPETVMENVDINLENVGNENNINFLNKLSKKLYGKDKGQKVHPYLLEQKFHKDYQDIQNAIITICPSNKETFNRSCLPIIRSGKVRTSEVKYLIKDFIKQINNIVSSTTDDVFNLNKDWKKNTSQQPYDDGWEKQQKKLGLPSSLYNKPVGRTRFIPIHVQAAEKAETDEQIKYTIVLICTKVDVKDQMVLQLKFLVNKHDLDLEREFFDRKKNEYRTTVYIEYIDILGFMTKDSFGTPSVLNTYQNFDNITDGRMFNDETIVKLLNNKRKEYAKEAITGII